MKIALVDDDIKDLNNAAELLINWQEDKQILLDIFAFSSGKEFLSSFEKDKYSAVFLDIYMDMSGMELAREIRKVDEDIKIIFTTMSEDFFAEGYDVEAVHYLLKPLTREKVAQALHRLRELFLREESYIYFPDGKNVLKIKKNEIMCVETRRNGINIILKDEIISANCSLSEAKRHLQFENFYQCHRYCIVCFDWVLKVEEDAFILENGTRVIIRREGRKQIKEAYYHYFMKNLRD